jgi:hypothetical protein
MNETELLALYRDNASLRKQLADAEIREMELKNRIEGALTYVNMCSGSLTNQEMDEVVSELTCLLNGE